MKVNINKFTGKCSCGREHNLVVKDVFLEEGAIKKLPEILKMEAYSNYKNFVMTIHI